MRLMAGIQREYKDRLFNFIFGSEENNLNKYGSELLKLPVPKLIVFYNGVRDAEDETILRLSDSFPEGSKPDIEVTVRMININYGRNQKLLDACEPLKEYSRTFLRLVIDRKEKSS